jgi:RNA polymerase sigma factor (sigma-70 family)
LTRELGLAPTFDQVAETLKLTVSQRALVGHALHSRALVHDTADDESRLARHMADGEWSPEAELECSEEQGSLRARIEERLDERERLVIDLRFGLDGGDPQTLKEIGQRLGVTREWVRRIEKGALSKLQGEEDEAPGVSSGQLVGPRREFFEAAIWAVETDHPK